MTKRPAIDTLPLFPDVPEVVRKPMKLTLNAPRTATATPVATDFIPGIPQLVLPTRWELLQPKLQQNDASLKTIIRPVPLALKVVRDIVEYLNTTGGCQVLVVRADTGSGKTTFLNTLSHYIKDIVFSTQTIDLQDQSADDFGRTLRALKLDSAAINLIILEGREKPESINDAYIQNVLANINRFARTAHCSILVVIPTIEEQVARSWCDHGTRIGDLIPEQKLYEGSRWYNFPGVAREKFVDVAGETVRALNPPHSLTDFGVSADEIKAWAETAPTIGKYMETLASKISDRRTAARIPLATGKRERVWIVYCGPDYRHFDHTYLVLNGLCQDDQLRVSPGKLIPPDTQTSQAKNWREHKMWAKLIATVNFLDVRLVNLPITTVVAAALAHGDEHLLNTFRETPISKYKEQIIGEVVLDKADAFDWDQMLIERKLQSMNARESMERSNLFQLLRGLAAGPQKGGKTESINVLAQYLHLRDVATESELHYYIGCTLRDLLKYVQFNGLIGDGVETETPLVHGQTDPIPDVAIHTETDVYALEFHFLRKQFAASEVARYALEKVIRKYMISLPHLRSHLDAME